MLSDSQILELRNQIRKIQVCSFEIIETLNTQILRISPKEDILFYDVFEILNNFKVHYYIDFQRKEIVIA